MVFGKKKKATAPAPANPADVVPKPKLWFWICKYFLFASILAIAIGMWAIIDQHLTYFPFTYDGPDERYQNMTANIAYCLLSNTPPPADSNDARCSFATASASVSFAIAIGWIVLQGLRNNKDRNYKLMLIIDGTVCLFGVAWWILCGVLLSIWTDQANDINLPGNNWRNGLSAMAWINFLLYCMLCMTSAVFLSRRAQQKAFADKPKTPKTQKDVETGAAAPAAAAPAGAGVPAAHTPLPPGEGHGDAVVAPGGLSAHPAGAWAAPATAAPAPAPTAV